MSRVIRTKWLPLLMVFCMLVSVTIVYQPNAVKAATNYYISNTTGNDNNAGTQASPWQTLSRISKHSIFTTQTPSTYNNDARKELGTKFKAKVAGTITQVKIYTNSTEGGDHTVTIWKDSDSTKVGGQSFTWTITQGTAGWKTFTLPSELSISANTDYIVSVSNSTDNYYASTANGFDNPINNGQLVTYSASGVYTTTLGNKPTSVSNNTNYFRDIVFKPIQFTAGDQILLAQGDTFTTNGNGVYLNGNGTSGSPITLSSYYKGSGSTAKPIITGASGTTRCIFLGDLDYWTISNLEINNAIYGVQEYYTTSGHHGITMDNLTIHDCTGSGVVLSNSNGTQNYVTDVTLSNCTMYNCTQTGLAITGVDTLNVTSCTQYDSGNFLFLHYITNLTVSGCEAYNCGPTNLNVIGVGNISTGTISGCNFHDNYGDPPSIVGITDICLQDSNDCTIEENTFDNRNRYDNDADGVAMDFEGNDSNCTFRNNNVSDTDGYGVLFCGTDGPNTNCTVSGNTFTNDARNPYDSGRKCEVYSTSTSHTATFSNNTFILLPGVPLLGGSVGAGLAISETNNTVKYGWDFGRDSSTYGSLALDSWTGTNVTGLATANGLLTGTPSTGPQLISSDNMSSSVPINISSTSNNQIRIKYKNNSGSSTAKIWFKKNSETTWTNDSTHTVTFNVTPNDTQTREYTVDMSNVSGWSGTLKQLRFDPFNTSSGTAFDVDYIWIETLASAPSMIFSDDFEDGNADGWTVSSGTWSVVTDGSSKVYKNTDTTSGDKITSVGDVAWTDYSVEAKVKFYTSDLNCNILGRFQDSNNFYYLSVDGGGNLLKIGKRVGGIYTNLNTYSVTLNPDTQYTIKLEMVGNNLKGYLNGIESVSYTDTNNTFNSGKIGFRCYSVAASVDDVIVRR